MQAPKHILDLIRIPWVRVALETVGIVLGLWVLSQLSGVLTPIGAGLALAYMVEPLVSWFERKHIARRYAAGVVFGGGALVLTLLIAIAIPTAWTEGVKLYRVGLQGDAFVDLPGTDGAPPNGTWDAHEPLSRDLNGNNAYDPSQMQLLQKFLIDKGWIRRGEVAVSAFGFDPEAWLQQELQEFSTEDGQILFGKIGDVIGRIGYWSIALLLVPVYAYFFSIHLADVSRRMIDHIPNAHRSLTLRILREINTVIGAFFRGRLMICAILGIVASIGFAFAATPSWFVLGALMGLATAIPLASVLVLAPVAMLLYLGGADTWQYVTVGVTYCGVQVLEPILISSIMGKGVEMHPVLIVVAILAFGTLLGGVGVLLVVPLAATARILYREFVYPQIRRIAGLDEPRPMLGDDPTAGA